jgi:hypothetical protein
MSFQSIRLFKARYMNLSMNSFESSIPKAKYLIKQIGVEMHNAMM